MTGDAGGEPEPEPLLRVVRGEPSPEELAALLAVVAARRADGAGEAAPFSGPGWRGGPDRLRRVPMPGPAAWQLTGRAGWRTRATW